MKINIIPDIHGSDKWKTVIDESANHIVFLGDYCDSFDHSNEQIINNLLDIIEFKKQNSEKVILLIGNHELPYIYLGDNQYYCSGHRPEIASMLHDILLQNLELFQNAFQVKDFLFTHAGVQNHWFTKVFKGNIEKNIAEQLNYPESREQFKSLYHVGYRRWGSHSVGGIFWCDRMELLKPLKGYIQIVGHTRRKEVLKQVRKDSTVWFCDCLEHLEKPIILYT